MSCDPGHDPGQCRRHNEKYATGWRTSASNRVRSGFVVVADITGCSGSSNDRSNSVAVIVVVAAAAAVVVLKIMK